MDAIIKQKWVAALRSGQYQQASGCLRTLDNKFCCLGVLCDILPGGRWDMAPDDDGDVFDSDESRYRYWAANAQGEWDYQTINLPIQINDRCGITTYQEHCLIDMNDNGVSFDKIAALIESQEFEDINAPIGADEEENDVEYERDV